MVLLYIADFLAEDLNGGAEQNDAALLQELSTWTFVRRMRCNEASAAILKEYLDNAKHVILLGNCTQLSKECTDELCANPQRYCIIEHDHHYLKRRNPSIYPQGVAPTTEWSNQELFQCAQAVFCQSSLHKLCIIKNTTNSKIINLGCNFWSTPWLETLHHLRQNKKKPFVAVQEARTRVKNSGGALKWCKRKHLHAELIPSLPYPLFLQSLSHAKALAFFPLWVESFSRLCMEAALLGLQIHGNANIGVLHESWFMRHQRSTGIWDDSLFNTLQSRQNKAITIIKQNLMQCARRSG